MLPESAKSVRLGVGARPPALFSAVFTGRGIEMKYTIRPKRLAVVGTAAVCLLLGLTACSQKPETAALQNDDALLTVDGCAVTEDEYLLFLRDQKAVTANYYWTQYQMQPDGEFWHTEVDGQTPLDFAKERALQATVTAKETMLLAAEQDVLDYRDYPEMLQDMQAENEDRAQKKQNGEVYYGVNAFTPFTYYQYLTDNATAEMETAMEKQLAPTDAELQQVYEEYKDLLSLGTTYRYRIETADGTLQELTRNTREIGKTDTVTEDLIYGYFTAMQPGQSFAYEYYGQEATGTLLDVQDEGVQTFEKAKDSLKVFYARQKLADLLEQRTQNADVVLDQARYDALEMP